MTKKGLIEMQHILNEEVILFINSSMSKGNDDTLDLTARQHIFNSIE